MDDLTSRAATIDVLKRAAYWQDAERKIAELPTIDAIPVAWLRKIQANMPQTVEKMGVDVILMMWEKEQEG